MTFVERYYAETTWQGKVIIMEIYHLTMITKETKWTLSNTAEQFGVSTGLVSENLNLANAFHNTASDKLFKCESRDEALRKLRNGRY